MHIEGMVRVGATTKKLVKQLNADTIAVIKHDDIDILSAISLINTGITVVLNTGKSMTGRIDAKGAGLLLKYRITLVEAALPLELFKNNDYISIEGGSISINGLLYKKSCKIIDFKHIRLYSQISRLNKYNEAGSFISNTLQHAAKDMDSLLSYDGYPDIDTILSDRQVLVVSRNSNSLEDILSLRGYINACEPVLVGVDGGADLLLNCGYTPDILIGDMDSVSDVGISMSKELILHTFPDGGCPCLDRIKAMCRGYKTIAIQGTSEDAALMLSYSKGAGLIVLIGGHNCMEDFLLKGRAGMGSTLITRLIIGDKLLDAKNISILFKPAAFDNTKDRHACL